MKEDLLKHLLESILGRSKSARGGDEAVFTCPSCQHHKKKLTVNLSSQKFQCWVCNYKGHRAFQILKKVNAPGVIFSSLKEIDLYYCEEGPLRNMVVIPSYDKDGFLNYYVGRSFDKNAYIKHKLASSTKDIIGFEMYINWDLPVILCEGVFDAMTIKRNAIPLFGKKISTNLMKKIIESKVEKIYLALDEDALKDAFKHAETFLSYGKKVYLIEMGDKDPSELGFENFTKLLHNATKLTTSILMKKRLALS
jgi:DNA primase